MKKKIWLLLILLISIFIFSSSIYAMYRAELISLCQPSDEPIICQHLEKGIDYPLISYEEIEGDNPYVLAVINGGKYIIVEIDGKIYIVE